MSTHARFSPSSAHRWMRCPGSLAVTEKLPPEGSNHYADEGTAAHELAEWTLNQEHKDASVGLGVNAENGHEFTEDMCAHVQTYVNNIMDYAKDGSLYVEQQVDFSRILNQPDSFGTADAVIATNDCAELQVHDLKYGMGVKVYAKDNEQLMLYAIGALEKYDVLNAITHVRMVIHQPRLHHLDDWVCDVEKLREFGVEARREAQVAAKYAENPGGDNAAGFFHPGTKQCRWCRAKPNCEYVGNMVAETLGTKFEDLTTEVAQPVDPSTLDVGRLSELMPLLDMIVDWTKAVRGEAERLLLNGDVVPDYKLVEGKRGSRKWKHEDDALALFKSMRLKADEMYDMKVISPTKAEKLLKESPRRWSRCAEIITQSEGKPSVALESDKRPAINPCVTDKFSELT